MNLGGHSVRWQYKGNATTCIIGGTQERPFISRTVKVREGDVKIKEQGRLRSFRKAMFHLRSINEETKQVTELIPREQRAEMWKDFRTEIKSPIRFPEATAVAKEKIGHEVMQ